MTTQQQIEKLEKELAELKEKARCEEEALYKKAKEEREKELQSIKDAIESYNKKYGANLGLSFGLSIADLLW